MSKILEKKLLFWDCPNVCKTRMHLTHLPLCHIYASVKWVSIGSDNGLSPVRRQAIFWTNAGILLIGPLGINLSEV